MAGTARSESAEEGGFLSERGATARGFTNFMATYGGKTLANLYHPENNPTGIVSLGIAENTLCEELWLEKFNQPEMNTFKPEMLYYFEFTGLPKFRKALADFLSQRLHSANKLCPDNIVVTSGCGAAMDYLAFCLANPGDYFMLFTPAYGAICMDTLFRSGVKILEVPLPKKDREDAKAYEQNVKDLGQVYEQAKSEGKNVRGLFIINPHNPTGNIVRQEKLVELLEFCARNKLHVFVNEIYALSVFGDDSKCESVLTLESVPDPMRTHFLWGFSKDFGLSGMRCGVLYSQNSHITDRRKMLEMSFYLGSVPPVIQEKLRCIITDTDWLDTVFFPANRQRMKKAYQTTAKKFRDLGIETYDGQAGFFVWANFGKFLKEATEESELDLMKQLFEAGVYMLPGMQIMNTQPGWFRVTFTQRSEILEEGFRRIESVLSAQNTTEGAAVSEV